MRYAMAIDLDRCIGCRTCAVICKDHNAEPRGIWWNRVFAPGAPEYGTSVIVDGMPRMEFLPISCQHCENAPCQQVCPTGATYTDDTGTVLVDYEKCIGCRYCITACPYEVRQFNWSKPEGIEGVDGEYRWGYPEDYRQDGRARLHAGASRGCSREVHVLRPVHQSGRHPGLVARVARQTPAYSATSRIPSPRSRSIFPGASGSSSANRTAPTRRCITCLPSAERGSNHDGANS